MKAHLIIIFLTSLIFTISSSDCAAAELEYGPYEVGFDYYKSYDHSRPYIMGEDTISRPLLIHLWFPSIEKDEGQALNFKDYIDLIAQRENFAQSKSEIDMQSFYFVKGYSDFAKHSYNLDTGLTAELILSSPVLARNCLSTINIDSEFPLLIYAPSNSKSSVQNHMICEYLASHGFMILSVASAGLSSIQRENLPESIMAQVLDMEYILDYCQDSLQIQHSKLGVFGFSSGGNAMTLFQLRNGSVDAVFSMDGGQEYGAYQALYKMADFNIKKTNVPYCSIVNNYEDFSIYPIYNSVITSEKYMFRMPSLDHNGFISHWSFFESCSSESTKSNLSLSYESICECARGFFSKYLKSETSSSENSFFSELDTKYIQPLADDQATITLLCNALLDSNMDLANKLLIDNQTELIAKATQINILARMFIGNSIDLAIWLYTYNVETHPDSWQSHYDLAYAYKEKGEKLLAANALQKAEELNPGNSDITALRDEVSNME